MAAVLQNCRTMLMLTASATCFSEWSTAADSLRSKASRALAPGFPWSCPALPNRDPMPIRVSIVEDNRDTRASLQQIINGAPGLYCTRTYATGEAAVEGVHKDRPDVALVDIN